MAQSRTVTGKSFEYTGSLTGGLTIRFERSALRISPDIIQVVRQEIVRRSPVLMGANRQPLVRDSIGETLRLEHGKSPQIMSYVLPLLIEEGFCTVSDRKPFVIRKVDLASQA